MFQFKKKELLFHMDPVFIWIIILIYSNKCCLAQDYPYRCSIKLETALEHMLRRNQVKSGGRTSFGLSTSPYAVYNSLYNADDGVLDDSDSNKQYNDRRSFSTLGHRTTTLNSKLDKLYGGNNVKEQQEDRKSNFNHIPITKVEVADLKVRLPNKSQWVHVDKCQFSASNRTLDTRLIFPDLTISGKVILHPTGGKCNMILRLRKAGIEFRTIPLQTSIHESRRSGTASVRTDSHFSEPGFLSVFAHGCQGPSGLKYRQNSKKRNFNDNNSNRDPKFDDNLNLEGSSLNERQDYARNDKFYDKKYQRNRRHDTFYDYPSYRRRTRQAADTRDNDKLNLADDIFNLSDENLLDPNLRTFNDLFSNGLIFGNPWNTGGSNIYPEPIPQSSLHNNKRYHNRYPNHHTNNWYNVNDNLHEHSTSSPGNSGTSGGSFSSFQNQQNLDTDEINDALSRELEQLFSMGVRGILTTYMQKALQPAIKETLMENMGYTLSYG